MPASLPADHHDDDGRPAWRITSRHGQWNWSRITQTARHHDRRGPGGEPAVDAIYNTGCLPVYRPYKDVGRAPTRQIAPARSGAVGSALVDLCQKCCHLLGVSYEYQTTVYC